MDRAKLVDDLAWITEGSGTGFGLMPMIGRMMWQEQPGPKTVVMARMPDDLYTDDELVLLHWFAVGYTAHYSRMFSTTDGANCIIIEKEVRRTEEGWSQPGAHWRRKRMSWTNGEWSCSLPEALASFAHDWNAVMGAWVLLPDGAIGEVVGKTEDFGYRVNLIGGKTRTMSWRDAAIVAPGSLALRHQIIMALGHRANRTDAADDGNEMAMLLQTKSRDIPPVAEISTLLGDPDLDGLSALWLKRPLNYLERQQARPRKRQLRRLRA